jgi:hypothetical protein
MRLDTLEALKSEALKELHERWKCKAGHSKDPNRDVYCYPDPITNICWALAIPDLGFWALEMVCKLSG